MSSQKVYRLARVSEDDSGEQLEQAVRPRPHALIFGDQAFAACHALREGPPSGCGPDPPVDPHRIEFRSRQSNDVGLSTPNEIEQLRSDWGPPLDQGK